jgi:hypothetical protein
MDMSVAKIFLLKNENAYNSGRKDNLIEKQRKKVTGNSHIKKNKGRRSEGGRERENERERESWPINI